MAEIVNVIKYEGDNSTFIWKHPKEDFNSLSQLVVHENQEAIFFMDGKALDTFGPGRYTLETRNIPLLSKFINIATDGISPFHCEVYFINKTERMAIKWGTDSRVQYVEPTYGFPISLGASGEMAIKVNDGRKLLLKLVGTESEFTQSHLSAYFRGVMMTRVKTYIARVMKEKALNIFEIDQNLLEFSEAIKELLVPDFIEYGIDLEKFFVSIVLPPKNDAQYEKFKELHFRQYADIAEAKIRQQVALIDSETDAKKKIIEAKAMAEKRVTEGYTYSQERGFDIAESAAQNEGVGEFTNMGVGIGVMSGIGGTIGTVMKDSISNAFDAGSGSAPSEAENGFCENCGSKISMGAMFCEMCGTKVKESHCSKCGYKLGPTGNYCPKCGSKRGE